MAYSHYRVKWVLDVDAMSPQDAAHHALKLMRDKKSTATVFVVTDTESGQLFQVDLTMGEVKARRDDHWYETTEWLPSEGRWDI